MEDKLRQDIEEIIEELYKSQHPLDEEDEKLLNDNLWDLYNT